MELTWHDAAKENYKKLVGKGPEKASKEQYLLYAATMCILALPELEQEKLHQRSENISQAKSEGMGGMLLQYMEDELEDAEKYLHLYQATRDKSFKLIAKQELDHFDILVKHIKHAEPNLNINPYLMHYNELYEKIEKKIN